AGAGPKKGLLWAPDQMVTLDDRYFGLSGSWWVSARKLRQSRSGGTATTLTLHRPGLLLPELS
ncbi:MAG TPA: hypothetical protein PKY30_21170, partial [Myxococcota bacterium]|nr:hypothetical protein [Myxococcota bacterium]